LPRLTKSVGRLSVLSLLIGVTLAVSACGSSDDDKSTSASSTSSSASTTAAPKTEDVNFMLEWTPNASQVWAIAGKEKGLFQKYGINPNFLFPDDSTSPTKVLLAGKADAVLQLSSSAVTARGQGSPIKVVGTVEALDVGMMVLSDEISSVQDLKGKTVGVGASTYETTCTDRLLQNNGMTKDDVKMVDPGFNLVAPLLAGKIDGVNGSQYEQAIALAKSGKKTTVFSFHDNGCPIDPIQVVTTEKMIQEHPDTIKNLLKGIAASLQYAMDNPDEAAGIFDDKYPDLDRKSDLAQWQASVPTFCTEQSATKGLLYSDPEQYKELIQLSADAKAIDKTYPETDLVDNSLLPDPPVTAPCANDRYKDDPLSQVKGL
jgi:putative hydroxymethylpyrimidine transport system substrate-binding protein